MPEADLIPILSCMFLLIPALLLAMEVAKLGAITVSPPQVSVSGKPDKAPPERFQFSVMVRSDGFLAKVGKHGTSDGAATEIALDPEGHDFAALERLASDLKALHRDESQVVVTAEGDIPLSTLMHTMDALRGSECSLAGEPGGECLFWDVVIES